MLNVLIKFSDRKFKEISPVVQGAIDFLSSNDPQQLSDQQRGIQIVRLLNDINGNRGNKQLLKNLIGRTFGCVWRSVRYIFKKCKNTRIYVCVLNKACYIFSNR